MSVVAAVASVCTGWVRKVPNIGRAHYFETNMAMVQNLWLHFGVDEHPFATYFDVHQGCRGRDPQPYKNLPEVGSQGTRLRRLWRMAPPGPADARGAALTATG